MSGWDSARRRTAASGSHSNHPLHGRIRSGSSAVGGSWTHGRTLLRVGAERRSGPFRIEPPDRLDHARATTVAIVAPPEVIHAGERTPVVLRRDAWLPTRLEDLGEQLGAARVVGKLRVACSATLWAASNSPASIRSCTSSATSSSGSSAALAALSSAARAARRARSSACRRSRQHRLYFFPLPQGHGSLRPTFAIALAPTASSYPIAAPASSVGELRRRASFLETRVRRLLSPALRGARGGGRSWATRIASRAMDHE